MSLRGFLKGSRGNLKRDCFVASILAMTGKVFVIASPPKAGVAISRDCFVAALLAMTKVIDCFAIARNVIKVPSLFAII